jgi:hypothetical protein
VNEVLILAVTTSSNILTAVLTALPAAIIGLLLGGGLVLLLKLLRT